MLTELFRLGRDAEVRQAGGSEVANLSLAFDYYDPKSDNKRSTTWIEAALWGQQATRLAQYLTKGKLVMASISDIHLEKYQTRDGHEGTKLVGRVVDIKLAGGRDDASGAAPAPAPRSAAARPAAAPATRHASTVAPADFDDGDIPF